MVYGLQGAKWVPSFLRTIASTYWFAYQTVAGSLAVVAILDRWTGTPHSLILRDHLHRRRHRRRGESTRHPFGVF